MSFHRFLGLPRVCFPRSFPQDFHLNFFRHSHPIRSTGSVHRKDRFAHVSDVFAPYQYRPFSAFVYVFVTSVGSASVSRKLDDRVFC